MATTVAVDNLAEGTGTRSHGAVTAPANSWIVVGVIIEAGTTTVFTPSIPGLTFTKQNDTGPSAGESQVVQWTAPDVVGGSRTCTITPSVGSSLNYYSHLQVITGSDGPGTGKGINAAGQSVTVTRQAANSMMLMGIASFDTTPVGTPAWTPAGGATTTSQQGSGATYIFGRLDDAGAAANAAHGVTSPAYGNPSSAVLEMLTGGTPSTGGGRRPGIVFWPGAGPNPTMRFRPDPIQGRSISTALQTDLSTADITFTAVALDPVPQAVNINLTPAALTFSGVTLDPVPGQVSTNLTPANITFTAVAVNPTAPPVNITLGTADITFSAVVLNPVPQAVNINLTPAVLTFSGVALSSVPGQVSTNLTPAVLTFSAVAVSPTPQSVSINLTPAVLTFTATTVSPIPGQVSTNLTPSVITFVSVITVPVPQAVNVTLTPAVVTFTGIAVNPVPQQVSMTLTPAILSFVAVAVQIAGGIVSLELTPTVLTFTGVPLNPVPQQVSVNLTPSVLAFISVPVNPVALATVVTLTPAGLQFIAQALTPQPGLANINLTPAVLFFVAVALQSGARNPREADVIIALVRSTGTTSLEEVPADINLDRASSTTDL